MSRSLELGDLYRDGEGRLWCATEVEPYRASAHGDTWQDYSAVFKSVRRDGKLGVRFLTISTYDALNAFEYVGKAEISFQVNASSGSE